MGRWGRRGRGDALKEGDAVRKRDYLLRVNSFPLSPCPRVSVSPCPLVPAPCPLELSLRNSTPHFQDFSARSFLKNCIGIPSIEANLVRNSRESSSPMTSR